MKTVLVERRGHTLVPADPYSYEALEAFPEGKPLNLELKTSRSKGSLNLYWAGIAYLMQTAFSEADDKRWPTPHKYHEAMLDSLGYTYRLWRYDPSTPTGYSFRTVVDSIALDKMEEEDFKVLFERVRAITMKLFDVDPWDEWLKERGADWQTHWDKRRNWRPGDKD